MENLETEQNESPEVNQEALTQESDNSYQEVLQDKDFFALPYSERVELKKIVREKLPESGKEALDLGWTPKGWNR